METGFVKVVRPSFAFIAQLNGPDLFAHRSEFVGDLWDDPNLVERRVEFAVERTEKGLKATAVRAAN